MKKFIALLALAAGPAFAAPIGVAVHGGNVITFYDEPCTVAGVKNLTQRVVWLAGAVKTEGCFGIPNGYEIILAYFADQEIAVIPLAAVKPVRKI
jgi:hypothetical protein